MGGEVSKRKKSSKTVVRQIIETFGSVVCSFNRIRFDLPGADIERVQERIGPWSSSAELSDIPYVLYV